VQRLSALMGELGEMARAEGDPVLFHAMPST
jgi:hypothetical protein